MRRELIISYAGHGVLILIFFFASAFSRPKVSPQKVYMVKVIAAPQPKVVEQPEKQVEEKPKAAIKAEPKPTKRHKPKPKVEKPKIEPKKTSPTGKGHITVDGSAFADDFYLNLVYMKVYRNWVPQSIGREISATIYFIIMRDGRVKDAKVEKRSGVASFDQAALRTVLEASPFPELPESYRGDHLGIHFEFVHNP
ncbi:TonB family protein [bacterium]|nr:TonB family protein [bacterium]